MMEENTLVAMAKRPSEGELEYLQKTFNYIPPDETSKAIRMHCNLAGSVSICLL